MAAQTSKHYSKSQEREERGATLSLPLSSQANPPTQRKVKLFYLWSTWMNINSLSLWCCQNYLLIRLFKIFCHQLTLTSAWRARASWRCELNTWRRWVNWPKQWCWPKLALNAASSPTKPHFVKPMSRCFATCSLMKRPSWRYDCTLFIEG